VAFGIDWPGWSRGARSVEVAVETLESYRERYRPVAGIAGIAREFDAAGPLEIVEDRVGTGSSAIRSAPGARTSRSRSGCYRRARRLARMDCASIGRPTSRRCVRTTPGRSRGACGPGRCGPTLRLPRTRPCVGDGGQGPHRPGRGCRLPVGRTQGTAAILCGRSVGARHRHHNPRDELALLVHTSAWRM
jgi:hypothetical protein